MFLKRLALLAVAPCVLGGCPSITKADSNVAWGRAQIFISKYGTGIGKATDYVLESRVLGCTYALYSAQRLPLDREQSRITVSADPCSFSRLSEEEMSRQAHVFAYFVKTGILACDREGTSACLTGYERPPVEPLPPPAPDTGPTPSRPAVCPGLPSPTEC